MNEYIGNFLDQLQHSLNDRVSGQFQQLKHSIEGIDGMLGKAERVLEIQDIILHKLVEDRRNQGDREITAAEHLLKNVKGSFRVQKEKLD